MHLLAIICFISASAAMLLAILYQRRDLHPSYGNTMGGQMTVGVIWLLASVLSALGIAVLTTWYWSIPVFFLVFALSFVVRTIVARVPKR